MGTVADYVVVGSGLAGLYFALKASQNGSVILITKSDPEESNSSYAQGGIAAAVAPDDTLASHVADTLAAGDGLSDPDAVKLIVGRGPGLIAELERLGARFTRDCSGRLSLGREGGHSAARVVRAEDLTGKEVTRALLAAVRRRDEIEVRCRQMALDLMMDADGACAGIRVVDLENEWISEVQASVVMLATGGCGRIYQHTTNPAIATGDGIALAYRAGARLANMEFVQFHPTVLYHPEGDAFLISEAVRGYGGILVNRAGESFVESRHPLGSLATRDVLTRAIVDEMQQSGEECVWLDVTRKEPEATRKRFPNIYRHCLSVGIDMTREPIPVVPAAHYMCGGVCTDLWARTSIPGLYAAGETGMTGLHGANRLASNSLLEAAVMADRAATAAAPPLPDPWPGATTVRGNASRADVRRVTALRGKLQQRMWNDVGIVRSDAGLRAARAATDALAEGVESLWERSPYDAELNELRNMVGVASLVTRAAQQRRESRGGHHNVDHPHRDDAHWQRPIYLHK